MEHFAVDRYTKVSK